MRVGLNAWAFDGAASARACIRATAAAGFDGLEINLSEAGACALDCQDAEYAALGRFARDTGIEIHGVCTALYWQYSLTSPDPERRRRAMAILRRQIEVARLLGARHVLCVPGAVGVDLPLAQLFPDEWKDVSFDTRSEVVDYAAAYERAVCAMCEASVFAADADVTVCAENVGNKFLLSPLEMARFLDDVGSPYVRAYFDVGNVYRIGYPEHWIRALGARIAMVHLKDYCRARGRFVPLTTGDTDFDAVMRALRGVGYDGWLTAEYMGCAPEDGAYALADTARAMRTMAEKGRL